MGGHHGAHEDACSHDAAALIARAERLCAERRLQLTRTRRRVLEAVARSERPLGAYDIAESLSEPGARVAPVSVYRALDFLTELGLVHRIASRNAFVPCDHEHAPGEAAVFMICRTCGGVDETVSPEAERGLDRTLASAGFTPARRIVEVEGECAPCRERAAAGA